ncbi:hypothetical protein BLOT_004334 [Blomia tropicalis]|nr:hypothetical protein BLOT_004334 [Blomia tropicalis]
MYVAKYQVTKLTLSLLDLIGNEIIENTNEILGSGIWGGYWNLFFDYLCGRKIEVRGGRVYFIEIWIVVAIAQLY